MSHLHHMEPGSPRTLRANFTQASGVGPTLTGPEAAVLQETRAPDGRAGVGEPPRAPVQQPCRRLRQARTRHSRRAGAHCVHAGAPNPTGTAKRIAGPACSLQPGLPALRIRQGYTARTRHHPLACRLTHAVCSMVNERVGSSQWESSSELGDTWASRNAFSYGRCAPPLRCPDELHRFRFFSARPR